MENTHFLPSQKNSHKIKFQEKIILCFLMILVTFLPIKSQKYFSPNPKPVVNHEEISLFLARIPEISLKADFYNISRSVLETVLVLQSNAGSDISDGSYNYGRILVRPELTSYPAFSKSKDGYILCSTRSRGIEATALSLSLLRNKGKQAITDTEWLNLLFNEGGNLHLLKKEAEIIYKTISGKSFEDVGVHINVIGITSTEEKMPATQNQPETKQASIIQDTFVSELKSIDLKSEPIQSDSIIERNLEENSIQKTEVFTDVDFRHEGKNTESENKNLADNQNVQKEINSFQEEPIETKPESNTHLTPQEKVIQEKRSVKNEIPPTNSIPVASQYQEKNPSKSHPEKNQQTTQKFPTDKGNWLYGGYSSLFYFDDELTLDLHPNYGYFLANNFVLGYSIRHLQTIEFSRDDDFYNSLGLFIRAYGGKSQKGRIFGQIGGSVGVVDFDFEFPTLSYNARIGYARFLNQHTAWEFSIFGEEFTNGDVNLGFGLGYQIHFRKD